MKWVVQDNQLIPLEVILNQQITAKDILAIEYAIRTDLQGNPVNSPSSDLPDLDFSLIDYFSELIVKVFTPSTNVKKKPLLSLFVRDPDFNEHELHSVPISDHCICDGYFLMLQVEALKSIQDFFIKYTLGPLDFHALAELYKTEQEFLEFIVDDDRCVDIQPISIPSELSGIQLYPYQEDGVAWMTSVVSEGVGCVLADEMGLGKTFQIIAILLYLKTEGLSVVIAPNSLLENWSREIARFAPSLKVLVHRGHTRSNSWKVFCEFDVIVTSYDLIKSDFSLFSQFTWNLMILDEAQAIKNFGSQRSTIIRDLPKRAGIAVSGTPFENHMTDIWSIFDFVFPGLLGSDVNIFMKMYEDTEASAKVVERIISPLLLRRLVKNVQKELPERVLIPEILEMEAGEAEDYERIRQDISNLDGKVSMGSLIRLRQYCALPSLIDKSLNTVPPEHTSAKFNRLFEILEEIYFNNEKALVFTAFREIQSVIVRTIENRFCINPFIINGDTPQSDRQRMVDAFSSTENFSVLIINPTIGGTGLNITAANHVIFYTLEWNPALEDQCIARSLRIGQHKTVFVHRLFYANTVEEVMNNRLSRKRDLSAIVVQGIDGSESADIQRAINLSPFVQGDLR